MNKNFLNIIIFIIVSIILLYFARNHYKEFNINKSIQACLVGQTKKEDPLDIKEARKICEDNIKKK